MGRKSALTLDQWVEIERRHLVDCESINALAIEFGINESSIRRKIKPNKAESPNTGKPLRELAIEKIAADKAVRNIAEQIAELPYAKQQIVSDLARKLVSVSDHLSSAAEYGSITSHRLSMLANQHAERIDDVDPMSEESMQALRGIDALTKMANSSSEIGMNLLRANKDFNDNLNKENSAPIRRIERVIVQHG